MKKVLIHITDRHVIDGEKMASELTTVGTLQGSGDAYRIAYTETDDDFQECTTTLELEEGRRVVMTRSGPNSTQMILERDKRFHCHYSTPYGDIAMGIYTKALRSCMRSDGGQLNFRYTIDYNTGYVSTNELTVTVTGIRN